MPWSPKTFSHKSSTTTRFAVLPAPDDATATTFFFDGVAYETRVMCIQYDDSADFFYSLVTFDEDVQKHFIARFATEVGLVEIEFESVWAQLPTLGFNDAYKKAFTEAGSVRQ